MSTEKIVFVMKAMHFLIGRISIYCWTQNAELAAVLH